ADAQVTALVRPLLPQQPPAATIQGSGQVTLRILTWRTDPLLPAPQHVVGADLRVEVDVDLVAPQQYLVGGQFLPQAAQFPQAFLLAAFPPGAHDIGFGPAAADTVLTQQATHGGACYGEPGLAGQNLHEQFLGPRGARVAVVLG